MNKVFRLLAKSFLGFGLCLHLNTVLAGPSVPYMPTWQARHHLQLLVDEAQLAITTSHWPLPLAAVQNALDELPKVLPAKLQESREIVLKELRKHRWEGRADLQLRAKADAPVGFGDNYTPGSSLKISTSATEFGPNNFSVAAKLGLKIEQSPNSLQTNFSGWNKEGQVQAKLDDTALVVEGLGINWQFFSHQNWWGPAWQSSLINSNNAPPWMGVGLQRSEVKPSESKWLSWMGAWNAELFVAKAQDPLVAANQPDGYIFIGTRLTLKPTAWAEIGLSRGTQTGGSGRPSTPKDIAKNFFGFQTHTFTGNLNEDASNQIAGYDLKLTCPSAWRCSSYFQWMGEDASGQSHMPNQFMSLAGAEWTTSNGRHRIFGERSSTYVWTLPWNDANGVGSGYRNWAYSQGYTNGGRWIGSSFGGDARVFTLGWMDAQDNRMVKLFTGEVSVSQGSYNPSITAPKGKLTGAAVQQSFQWRDITITPELSYQHLAQNASVEANKRTCLRGSVTFSMPLGQ